jgi:ATP-binding cassette subfamily C protein
LYASIAGANWLFLSRNRSADLSHLLTQELDRVGSATYEVHNFLSNAFISIVYIGLAARVSPAMTLSVTACGLVLLAILGPLTLKAQKVGTRLSKMTRQLYTAVIEHIAGLRTAKSYGAERRHVESFNEISDAIADAETQTASVYAVSQLWFDIGSVVAMAILVFVGLTRLGLNPASVLLLIYLFGRLMPRISALQRGYQYLAHLLPSFEAVIALQARFDREQERRPASAATIAFRHRIRLDRVRFAYDPAGPNAVDDLSLDIQFGSLTAIVGPSGAGKSTVADLLTGLHVPQHGRILVDEQPLDDVHMTSWKEGIGYVAQDTFVFHDTVRANLLWANPSATEADILDALRMAEAQFILEAADGLETVLGDRGLRLSGGERQRLALARALVRRPRLLILDEATSALDLENERRVLATIERLKGTVTTLLITHRLPAVRGADIIHVIAHGRVVESGDWTSLRSRPQGLFSGLWDLQDVERTSDQQVNAIAN